jgi:crossover junction endodeoxyribonuclease RuvC
MGERMFDTCVLGVDPGVARLGLAVVGREGRTSALVWADTIRTPSNQDESARLLHLVSAMRAAIAQHGPTCVAIERVAFSRNRSSALTVARVTGAVMVVAAEAGLPVAEYSPTQVKSAVTGIGNADKDQVRTALIRVHAMREVPDQPDAADAIAVALTHLTGERLRTAARAVGAR